MHNVQLVASEGHDEGSQGCQGSDACRHQGQTMAPPTQFPAGYLINIAHSGAGEHWVAAFLKDSKWSEYFNSYSTMPLGSIYQCLREMGYWYHMLQHKNAIGSILKVLRTLCLLTMQSRGLPLGEVTSVFWE